MDAKEALKIADEAIFDKTGKHLTDVQRSIFEGSWKDQAYKVIAENCYREEQHVKNEGSKFWKLLSEALGEKVAKNNFKTAIERKKQSNSTPTPSPEEKTVPTKKSDMKENNTDVFVYLASEGLLSYLKKDFFQDLKNEGLKYAKEGDYRTAIEYYTKAIRLNPNDPNVYHDLGVIYSLINDYKRAFGQFDKAILLGQTESKFYYKRGLTEYNLGYKEAALRDLQEAIKLCSDNDLYYHDRGIIYRELNDYKNAINDFNQALKINPNVAGYHMNRGKVLFLIGNLGEARKDYEAALELFWKQGDRENYEEIARFLRKLKHSAFLSRERNRRNATTSE